MTDVREELAPATVEHRPQPQGDFIWYELMTPDPDGAKAFYDAVVGWDIEPQPAGEMDYRMIRRSDRGNAGGVMRLTSDMESHGARPTWLGYINVADVDAATAAIEKAGGKTFVAPFDIPNTGRIAMVADPQGAPFYIMTPTPRAEDPNAVSDVFSTTAEQRVGWNELQTEDVEAARQFYGDQFGWESDDYMDMGPMGLYRFFDFNGTRLGALFNASNGQPSHWRFYFRVPSIAAARESVAARGGTVHMGPHQVPTGDWVLICSDPQGAEFALVGGE